MYLDLGRQPYADTTPACQLCGAPNAVVFPDGAEVCMACDDRLRAEAAEEALDPMHRRLAQAVRSTGRVYRVFPPRNEIAGALLTPDNNAAA